MSKWGKVLAGEIARHSTLGTSEGRLQRMMTHPAFVAEGEEAVDSVWAYAWRVALENAREYNNRDLLHGLLDAGRPVPAKIARQLLDLKGVANRGKAIKQTPELVALLVCWVRMNGFPFKTTVKAPDCPTAFEVVAEFLLCDESTVAAYWRKCPPQIREEFKHEDADSLLARWFEHPDRI